MTSALAELIARYRRDVDPAVLAEIERWLRDELTVEQTPYLSDGVSFVD